MRLVVDRILLAILLLGSRLRLSKHRREPRK